MYAAFVHTGRRYGPLTYTVTDYLAAIGIGHASSVVSM